MSLSHQKIHIIAHRGFSSSYPENTLLAYKQAYKHGARWFECDIQLTKDHQAIVHHDANLQRMAGIDIDIRMIALQQLKKYSAFYPDKFGDKFYGNPFTTLDELIQWLTKDNHCNLFIEIKQESIDYFGLDPCIKAIDKAIKNHYSQCIIISFNQDVVQHYAQNSQARTGWIIPEWTDKAHQTAKDLQPDFLFSNKKLLPNNPEDWWKIQAKRNGKWAIYNVDEAQELDQWINKGLQYIETNNVAAIMQSIRA